MLPMNVIDLATVSMTTEARRLRSKRIEQFGSESVRKFPDYEWQRLSYAFGLLQPGRALLEVGPGRGYLSQMIAKERLFQRQVAIDVVEAKSPSKFGPRTEFRNLSIEDIDYPDRSFDVVVCMEVLEHLDDATLEDGLAQIRRICGGKLIMSVPLLEPEPLPSYHKQRFDEARIKDMFPQGKFTLLLKAPVTRVPWLLIEEERDGD